MIALFDMDGSLCDYDGAMRRELEKICSPGEEVPENPWDAKTSPHWEARMDLIKRQPGFWRELEPITLGMRVYEILRNLGYAPVVLTKGPKRTTTAWTEKADWCARWIPDASVTITEDKGLVYGKVLYDDWPSYIEAWLKHRPRGKVIMRDTIYNRGFSHPQVERVYDAAAAPHVRTLIERFVGAVSNI